MMSKKDTMALPNKNDTSDTIPSEFPESTENVKMSSELKEFYTRHGVVDAERMLDATQLSTAMRFIRLNPRYDKQETLNLLQEEFGIRQYLPVPWLDERYGFYAIPGSFSLAQSQLYRSGRIYGMDVSSGAAVAALLSELPSIAASKIRVLDLCCSPGLKLCMIADNLSSSATVVGVDISEQRLAVCKNIVKKYRIDPATCGNSPGGDNGARIRLYCTDGTTFGTEPNPTLVFDSVAAIEDQQVAGKRKRMNKSARARERKRLRQLSSFDQTSRDVSDELAEPKLAVEPFDYVLVDAECSTDGSLKHVQQRAKKANGEVASNETLTDPSQLESLVKLQQGLISSGFKLLKPGGTLVYSTCSLSVDQNECVVEWLMKNNRDAFVIPVKFPLADDNMVVTGSLEGTVRFLPGSNVAGGTEQASPFFGGGFFLAKLGKRHEGTREHDH